ncbi:hypothetical protein JVT61DRAFT_868 [Boletus reticuloceps]|uniref:Uncharacterized protein n=1 Tax=Boletus reticuloceps TaxID=495285 RepID=A0A8I3A9H9_9AGAM|nr:hypothetical protein JVT61DRAFT_868 [Boletus reticuloceps]
MASSSTSSWELRLSISSACFPPMRFLSTPKLSFLLTFYRLTYALVPDTDVVIVSNNDLNPSDPNRAGALLLISPLTCPETASTCAQLQETLLPPPTRTRADFTSENLTAVLASDRHGIMLPHGLSVWIAGNLFTVGCLFRPD